MSEPFRIGILECCYWETCSDNGFKCKNCKNYTKRSHYEPIDEPHLLPYYYPYPYYRIYPSYPITVEYV